jgi:hypothetical protein
LILGGISQNHSGNVTDFAADRHPTELDISATVQPPLHFLSAPPTSSVSIWRSLLPPQSFFNLILSTTATTLLLHHKDDNEQLVLTSWLQTPSPISSFQLLLSIVTHHTYNLDSICSFPNPITPILEVLRKPRHNQILACHTTTWYTVRKKRDKVDKTTSV